MAYKVDTMFWLHLINKVLCDVSKCNDVLNIYIYYMYAAISMDTQRRISSKHVDINAKVQVQNYILICFSLIYCCNVITYIRMYSYTLKYKLYM